MEFKFYQDIKVSVWKRQSFIIDAETEEQANEIAKKYKDFDVSNNIDDIYPFDFDELSDTEEIIHVDDNDGFPTIEILNEECVRIANNAEL